MPSHDHEPAPPEPENEQASRHNARLGLVMFFIYFAVYAGFMILNTFSPETMKVTIAGVNLAIIYGLGLIVLAVVMAVVYLMLCSDSASGGRKPSEPPQHGATSPSTRGANAPRSPGSSGQEVAP